MTKEEIEKLFEGMFNEVGCGDWYAAEKLKAKLLAYIDELQASLKSADATVNELADLNEKQGKMLARLEKALRDAIEWTEPRSYPETPKGLESRMFRLGVYLKQALAESKDD